MDSLKIDTAEPVMMPVLLFHILHFLKTDAYIAHNAT